MKAPMRRAHTGWNSSDRAMLETCLELAILGLALSGERHRASGGVEDPVKKK
jgi:hypothetical protein